MQNGSQFRDVERVADRRLADRSTLSCRMAAEWRRCMHERWDENDNDIYVLTLEQLEMFLDVHR